MPRRPLEDRILEALWAAGRSGGELPESPRWREGVMRTIRQLGRPAPPPWRAPARAWPWAAAAACTVIGIVWRLLAAVSPDTALASQWLNDPAAFTIQDLLWNL